MGSFDQKGHRFDATLCLGNRRDVDRAYVIESSFARICCKVHTDIENSLQAFPSGHASSSFAAAVFLSLYLNSKLKVLSDHSSPFWALMAMLTPLILASLVSGSMYTSHVSLLLSMACLRDDKLILFSNIKPMI